MNRTIKNIQLSILSFFLATTSLGKVAEKVVYSIPVEDRLKQYADFDLKSIKVKSQDNVWRVDYTLPEELLGYDLSLSFKSGETTHEEKIHFESDYGTMDCDNLYFQSAKCEVSFYPGLVAKVDEAKKIWINKNVSDAEFKGRMEVVEKFNGEPIGGLFILP